MSAPRLVFAAVLGALLLTSAAAADPQPAGVVVDLRGPTKGSAFKIDYLITLEGDKQPTRCSVMYAGAGYDPTDADGEIQFWRVDGFVLEKAGPTHIRFVGWKDKKTGKVTPVVAIKFESTDLPAEQLPTVVPGPKNKG